MVVAKLGPVEAHELLPGLWRWSVHHPGWEPDAVPESPADWPRSVGSVLYETGDAAVLVDPLLPPDREAWSRLDARIRGRPVVCLTTIGFHRRSCAAVVEATALPRPAHGATCRRA